MVHIYTKETEQKKAVTRRPLRSNDRIFLSKWVVSCVIGFLLAFVVAARITYTTYVEGVDPHTAYGNDNAVLPVLAFTFLITLTIAPTVALCQLYAIYHVRRILSLKRWALSVLLGAAISALLTVLMVLVSSAAIFTVAGCLFGPGALLFALPFGPGPGPWLLVLRPRRDAVGEIGSSWLLRSMFAWPLAIILGVATGVLSPITYKYPFNDIISMAYWGVGWTVGAVLYGIYTGLALLPLIDNSGFWPAAKSHDTGNDIAALADDEQTQHVN